MSYGDRISTIQEQGRSIKTPPDNAYFGGKPPENRLTPITDEERDALEAYDVTTPLGRFERVRRASEIAINRYVVGQLEHQEDGQFVEHLQRLVNAQLDFVDGMRSYFGIAEEAKPESGKQLGLKPVGRVLVPDAPFLIDFNELKGLTP